MSSRECITKRPLRRNRDRVSDLAKLRIHLRRHLDEAFRRDMLLQEASPLRAGDPTVSDRE